MIEYVKKNVIPTHTQAEQFKLHVGTYSGTAGDGLKNQNNMKFTTPDQDNDNYSSGNCATKYSGAWWHNSCMTSHLNGLNYGPSESVETDTGIYWNNFAAGSLSLKSVLMAIRPVH